MAISIPLTTYAGNTRGSSSGNASKSTSTSGTFFSPEMKALSDKYFGAASDSVTGFQGKLGELADNRTSGLTDNYAGQLALLQGIGNAQRDRINRDFAAQAGGVGAALAGTGLYNTTVQGNMAQGVERNRQEALGQLSESLAQQQLGALQGSGQQISAAHGDEMSAQLALAQLLSGLYESQASYLPTLSQSKSQSESGSTSYSHSGNAR